MKETEFISVVIPCYNDGPFLPETIQKLKKQTYPHFEIIIVNDGSTDPHTLSVLESLSKDPTITILNKENGRMSSARNYGVRHAQGTIIAALDADDYFHSSFFEQGLQRFAQNPRIAVVTSYIKMFGERTGLFKVRGGSLYNFLFSNQCPACAMVRKSCWDEVGGYDEDMKMGYEDWEFYFRITAAGYLVHVIPKPLFFYRQTKKSTLKNDTFPNSHLLIDYIVNKHSQTYLEALKKLIEKKEILYTETRISWQNIFKMIKNRLTGKYRTSID